ncbi:hypothetical protein QSJ18_20165, partial [Gordonia sp. ABSL1-1]|uniref:hypothetical protein n=1 Tax=Gordonia sp. ABSL1-1 TaxID=3053923 RepID=UPI002572EC35
APTPQATEPREADATQPDDPARTDDTKEFRHRLDDAIYTWQSRNGWRAVPHTIANALAERVIHEMRSERRQ